jgi:hypothetical protein
MITRKTLVCGVRIYSLDVIHWSSNRNEILLYEQRRDVFLAERSKSIKKSAIFVHKTRRIGRARRADQTRNNASSV